MPEPQTVAFTQGLGAKYTLGTLRLSGESIELLTSEGPVFNLAIKEINKVKQRGQALKIIAASKKYKVSFDRNVIKSVKGDNTGAFLGATTGSNPAIREYDLKSSGFISWAKQLHDLGVPVDMSIYNNANSTTAAVMLIILGSIISVLLLVLLSNILASVSGSREVNPRDTVIIGALVLAGLCVIYASVRWLKRRALR